MELTSLSPQAQSALVLSLLRQQLVSISRPNLSGDIVGIRLKDFKCILLIKSPIAKTEISLVLTDLQDFLNSRGYFYTLHIRLSTGNI